MMPFLALVLISSLQPSTAQDNCVEPPLPIPIPTPYPQSLINALTQLNTDINGWMKQYNTASFYASLIVGQETIWSQGYGVRNKAENPPVVPNGDTVYRIGSTTKTFTCLLTMQLRDKGLLDLDDPITTLYPDFSIKNPWQSKRPITIKQLMGQTSGLPRYSPCNSFSAPLYSCNETTSTILARLKNEWTAGPSQLMEPEYSNLAYALLGRGIERYGGGSNWENMVQTGILNRLNMTRTYTDYNSAMLPNYAVGYEDNSSMAAPYINLGWERPTGSIYASPNDMEKFVKSFLRFNDYNATDSILDPQTLREWFEPNPRMDGDGKFGMTFPWEFVQYGRYRVATKSGSVEGWTCWIAILPELNAGFVVQQSDRSRTIENARDALGNMLGTVLDPIMREYQPPPQYPASNPISDYFGIYVGQYGTDTMSFNITMQTLNNYPTLVGFGFLHQYLAQLLWYPQTGTDIFWLDQRNIPHPCWMDQAGIYMPVQFIRQGGVVVGFICPGLFYGMMATKVTLVGGEGKREVM